MAGFFDRMLGRGSKGSSSTAKERLQFVLVHDRINLPPERLRQMKEEIMAVISKYVAIDKDNVEVALQQRDRDKNMLIAEIPVTKQSLEVSDVDENDDLSTSLTPKTVQTDVIDDETDETLVHRPDDEDLL